MFHFSCSLSETMNFNFELKNKAGNTWSRSKVNGHLSWKVGPDYCCHKSFCIMIVTNGRCTISPIPQLYRKLVILAKIIIFIRLSVRSLLRCQPLSTVGATYSYREHLSMSGLSLSHFIYQISQNNCGKFQFSISLIE